MLGDDSEAPPQVGYVNVGGFGGAYRDRARAGFVHPLEKCHDGGFA